MNKSRLNSLLISALNNQPLSEWQRIGEGYGLASIVWRVPTESASLIFKVGEKESIKNNQEHFFYTTLANQIGIRVPQQIHYQENESHAILVLEDFPDAEQGDCLHPPSPAKLKELIRAFAQFHAKWWNNDALVKLFPQHKPPHLDQDWIIKRRTQLLEKYKTQLTAQTLTFLTDAIDRSEESQVLLRESPQVIQHGDFHLDNILFQPNNTPVILDWTRVRQGSFAFDLAHILDSMAWPEQQDKLLDLYLRELQNHGIECLEFESYLRGARIMNILNATLGIINWEPKSEREKLLIEDSFMRVNRTISLIS